MKAIPLRAGPSRMLFDTPNAFLRYVKVGKHEIVRGVFAAVRDRNWGTVVPRVENVVVESNEGGFRVNFDAFCRHEEIDFVWHGELSGDLAGTVRFTFEGHANSHFLRNRVGLCVLHPGDVCAGVPCQVEHVDGSVTEGAFPALISPHQPFKDIRAIRHEVTPGLHATVRMEGDTFEMEDQRNWTDASFKTYCTPLGLPFPVEIRKGAVIRQQVTISVEGEASAVAEVADTRPTISVNWESAVERPFIGLGIPGDGIPYSPAAVAALQELRPDHLRVDLKLHRPGWEDAWLHARSLAAACGAPLQAALFLSANAGEELDDLRQHVRDSPAPVSVWLVFHRDEMSTAARWIKLAAARLGDAVEGAVFASGTDAFFAELNRGRFVAQTRALPCFSIIPQFHAFDELSMVETLGAQRQTVETTWAFCPRPVVVSPITLRARFNPVATENIEDPIPETDPRQGSLFAAAWTAGSLACLGASGKVHSLTYYETQGPRGVMDHEGVPYPVFSVLEALRGFAMMAETTCSVPLSAGALALADENGKRRILVANFAKGNASVAVKGLRAPVSVERLEAGGFRPAGRLEPDLSGMITIETGATGVWRLDEP